MVSKTTGTMILLLVLASLGQAELFLPKEVTVKPGRIIKVQPDKIPGTPVRWINVHEDIDVIEDSSGKWIHVLATKPGRYKIAAYTADAKGPSDPSYCVVVVEGAVPPPEPGPGPLPPPPPKNGKVWVIAVVDNAKRTSEIAKVINDAVLWKNLADKGHSWRIYSKEDPEVGKNQYARHLESVGGPPGVLILDKAGGVLKVSKFPATSDGLASLVKEVAP